MQEDRAPARRGLARACQKAFEATLSAGVGLTLLPAALANPTGGQVVAGQAAISGGAGQLTVQQQSQRAVINWQGFSIDKGEITRFVQPSAASAVLNRVVSGNPSALLGTLQSNGQVFLINPNGILVGPGVNIDTGAFFASTRNIGDTSFMSGGPLGFTGSSNASIVNLGNIKAATGDVTLFAHTVENRGSISAPNGVASLAAGAELLYAPDAARRVLVKSASVAIAGTSGTGIDQQGSIDAAQVELAAAGGNAYALAINVGGAVRAATLRGEGGRLFVEAGDGKARVEGSLDASGSGRGGEVRILGADINLSRDARINASGATGGGTVLVGGDYQGGNAGAPNATTVTVDSGARITADALQSGDGGKVIVWSDDSTAFAGMISARGGYAGGNGGLAEVSGKVFLDYRGLADLRAAGGQLGSLLLDPTDITISAADDASIAFGSGTYTGSGAAANLSINTLKAQLAVSSVTISTSSTGSGNGDISWSAGANLDATPGGATSHLTLNAARDITIQADVVRDAALTLSAGRDIAIGQTALGTNFSSNHANGVSVTAGRDITLGRGANLDMNATTGTMLVKAGRSLTVNQGTLTGGGGLTLVADNANASRPMHFSGANMTFAAGSSVGNNAKIFGVQPSQMTGLANLPAGVSGTVTFNKWFGDSGTGTTGLYYKSKSATVNDFAEPMTITITAADASRSAGFANPTFSAASISGFASGDDQSVISGLSFTSDATAASAAGTYSIVPSGASATGYTFVYRNGTLTVSSSSTPGPNASFTTNQTAALNSSTSNLTQTTNAALPGSKSANNSVASSTADTTLTTTGGVVVVTSGGVVTDDCKATPGCIVTGTSTAPQGTTEFVTGAEVPPMAYDSVDSATAIAAWKSQRSADEAADRAKVEQQIKALPPGLQDAAWAMLKEMEFTYDEFLYFRSLFGNLSLADMVLQFQNPKARAAMLTQARGLIAAYRSKLIANAPDNVFHMSVLTDNYMNNAALNSYLAAKTANLDDRIADLVAKGGPAARDGNSSDLLTAAENAELARLRDERARTFTPQEITDNIARLRQRWLTASPSERDAIMAEIRQWEERGRNLAATPAEINAFFAARDPEKVAEINRQLAAGNLPPEKVNELLADRARYDGTQAQALMVSNLMTTLEQISRTGPPFTQEQTAMLVEIAKLIDAKNQQAAAFAQAQADYLLGSIPRIEEQMTLAMEKVQSTAASGLGTVVCGTCLPKGTFDGILAPLTMDVMTAVGMAPTTLREGAASLQDGGVIGAVTGGLAVSAAAGAGVGAASTTGAALGAAVFPYLGETAAAAEFAINAGIESLASAPGSLTVAGPIAVAAIAVTAGVIAFTQTQEMRDPVAEVTNLANTFATQAQILANTKVDVLSMLNSAEGQSQLFAYLMATLKVN